MSTGSQGEPMAVLRRMANRDHQIEVGEGDTVILASSLIPGNENAVYRVIDGLTKLGANVVHKGNAKVHVSGHAAAGELLYCYNILKPKNVLPIHGEYRHLFANAKLAQDTGIPEQNTVHRRERHGLRPARRRGARRRPARPRLRLRRRLDRRRDHRRRPQGPPDPRRGGLHLGHRRRRRLDRPDHRRTRDPRPRLRRGRRGVRRASSRRSSAALLRGGAATASATSTRCSRSCAARSARWVNQPAPSSPHDRAARHRGVASCRGRDPAVTRRAYHPAMADFTIRPAIRRRRVPRRHGGRGGELAGGRRPGPSRRCSPTRSTGPTSPAGSDPRTPGSSPSTRGEPIGAAWYRLLRGRHPGARLRRAAACPS